MCGIRGRSTEARHERVRCAAAVAVILLAACRGIDQDRSSTERMADSSAFARSRSPLLVSEWSSELWYQAGGGEDIIDFHAGHGLAALMRASSEMWIFTLHDSGRMVAGGLQRASGGRGFSRTEGSGPMRLLGIESDASVSLLDAVSGALSRRDVAGNVIPVGRLRVKERVTAACLARGGRLYFTDEGVADSLIEQRVDESVTGPLIAVRLPPPARRSAARTAVQLSGGPGLDCVMAESQGDSFYFMGPDASLHGHPHIEQLGASGPRIGLVRQVREWFSPPESAMDLSMSEELVAVLFAGRSAAANRIVDFYRPSNGTFVESVRLPAPAIRIALAHGRLFALSRRGGRLHLSSFVLPPSVRLAAPPVVPMSEARLPRAPVVADSTP